MALRCTLAYVNESNREVADTETPWNVVLWQPYGPLRRTAGDDRVRGEGAWALAPMRPQRSCASKKCRPGTRADEFGLIMAREEFSRSPGVAEWPVMRGNIATYPLGIVR